MRFEFSYMPEDFQEAANAKLTGPAATGMPGQVSGRALAVVLVVIGVAIGVLMFVRHRATNAPGGAPVTQEVPDRPLAETLLHMAPWLLVFAAIWFFLIRHLRRQAAAASPRAQGRRTWETNPTLDQPHACEVDADGVQLSTRLGTTRWRWPGIDAWTETANLFVLRPRGVGEMVIMPKRALPPGAKHELRQHLREHVIAAPNASAVVPPPPR